MLIDHIMIPPGEELIDFDAFASAMTTAPLEDLHKYIDSDDEQDLEDNYEGDSGHENLNEIHFENTIEAVQHPHHLDLQPTTEEDSDADLDDMSDGSCDTISDCGTPYTWFDERLDIDRNLLNPSHAASHHLDPHLQTTIDKTELLLERLSMRAQSMIDEQPLSTQIVLTNQAKETVFRPYGNHGSQARFSESVMRFLGGGDTVRRPGRDRSDKSKDGNLRFAGIDQDVHTGNIENSKGRLKRKAGDEATTDLGTSRTNIKVAKNSQYRNNITDKEIKENELHGKIKIAEQVEHQFQHGFAASSDESKMSAHSLSYRKTSGPHDFDAEPFTNLAGSLNSSTTTPTALELRWDENNCYQAALNGFSFNSMSSLNTDQALPNVKQGGSLYGNGTALSPLATTFSQFHLRTPLASTFPASTPSPTTTDSYERVQHSRSNYCASIFPHHNAALAREAYNPISLKFTWPATLRSSGAPCMPTPGLLDSLNRILHLHNAEARFTLSYYVRKYDIPAHLAQSCAGSVTDEPPHALFRLGIAQYVMSKVGKVIDHKEHDELGLNPEARKVLGEVWEAHPSTQAWFDDDFLENDSPQATFHDSRDEDGDVVFVTGTSTSPSNSDAPRGNDAQSDSPNPNKFKGGLNPLEKRILARACNISDETIDAYWEDMREKTKAWGAMKAWCMARSAEKVRRAKAEGRW